MKQREEEIIALRAENKRLKVENIQMQAALGYAIMAEDERYILPLNPFKCGTCDASKHLRAENERLREWNREIALNAREFAAENEKLRAALELFACDCTAKHLCAQPDNCVNYIARAALEGK